MWTGAAWPGRSAGPRGAAPGPPPGSRRKDHTRCWHRIRKSPGRRRHRPAVSAPRWRGSAGRPARSDLARRRRRPAARRSYPGRPAGRRGGPARLKHTRYRSPAPGCPRLPAPAARSQAVLQGHSTLPILVPWPPSRAGPDRRSRRPAGPRPPGCAAHDQALQPHPQRLRRRPARQPPHGPLAIRTAAWSERRGASDLVDRGGMVSCRIAHPGSGTLSAIPRGDAGPPICCPSGAGTDPAADGAARRRG